MIASKGPTRGRISFLVARIPVTEFRGGATAFMFRIIGPRTIINPAHVNGRSGRLLAGVPHEPFFRTQTGEVQRDRVRLAGNGLMWRRGPLIIRVLGARTVG